jgi:hypothetical protein
MTRTSINQCLTRTGQAFKIFTHSPITAEAAKVSFNDPTPGQDLKAFGLLGVLNDLLEPAILLLKDQDNLVSFE